MQDNSRLLRRQRWKTALPAVAGIALGAAAGWYAAGGGGFFAREARIDVLFDNVGGLRSGAPVRLLGKEIGDVEDLRFARDNRVRAVLAIEARNLEHLRQDSEAVIDTELLLGECYVRLDTGSAVAGRLEAGATLDGRLDRPFEKIVRRAERVIGRLDTFLEKIGAVSGELNVEAGTLARLLEDPALYDELKDASGSLVALLSRLDRGEGTLGRLLADERLYQELTASAKALHAFTVRLDDAGGSLERFMDDPTLYRNLNRASATLAALGAQVREGEGTLGRLIKDETLYRRLKRASGKLDRLLDKVHAGEGAAGRLFADERFSRDLAASVAEVKQLAADIRRDPEHYFDFSLW
jgi:phospholipid/cholesterol/gamma-HCH transport system substrate-binding protein